MTALAAAPQPDGGVLLTVTGAPAGALHLERTDANGYAVVRQPDALATTGTRWLVDYEVALTGAARYLVLDSAGGAAYATATWAGRPRVGPQLRRVFKPDQLVTVEAVLDLTAPRTLRRTLHELIGRSDDVFTTYRQGLRSGTLSLLATELPAATAIARLYGDGQAVLLRSPDHAGLDMAHLGLQVAPATLEEGADGRQLWRVEVTYAEVIPASSNTLGGWTCQDVLDTYATSAGASLAYATWADLIANEVG